MWQLLFTTGLLMICVRWDSAAADTGAVYVAVNGSAVLHPGSTVPESITTATWKHGENKAAELYGGEVICYRQFKGRCELDAATGVLTISPLVPSDSGFYSAEVNLNRADTVQLQVLDPVPKPLVSFECDAANTHCRLTCEGTTADPGLLEYRWKEDNEWSVSSKELDITKKNQEPEFSCEMKNPVSSSRSDPVPNPLSAGNSSAIIIGVVVFVLLLLVVAAAVVLFLCHRRRDAVQNLLRNFQSRVRDLFSGSGGAGSQHEVVKLSANGSATEAPLLESGGDQQESGDGVQPLLGAGDHQESGAGDQQEPGAGLPSPPDDVSSAAVASSSAEDHRGPDQDPGASGTSASNSDPVAVDKDVDVEVAAEVFEDPAESREDAETQGSGPGVSDVEPASRGPGLVTTADVHPEPPQNPSPSPEDHRGPDQDPGATGSSASSTGSGQ
ncbi:uncharacterized protein V6R79_023900 [Siganus canaliculatus]